MTTTASTISLSVKASRVADVLDIADAVGNQDGAAGRAGAVALLKMGADRDVPAYIARELAEQGLQVGEQVGRTTYQSRTFAIVRR